jgi:CRP/FNR family cyclic AMP-dependent transcriptional regulator
VNAAKKSIRWSAGILRIEALKLLRAFICYSSEPFSGLFNPMIRRMRGLNCVELRMWSVSATRYVSVMDFETFPGVRIPGDPLQYLPVSSILEVRKGKTIFGHDQPCTRIYLIMEGKVKLTRVAFNGKPVILDIYQDNEFFGETALVGAGSELAIALQNSKLMTWTIAAIEDIAMRNPKLAIAFAQLLVQRSMDCCTRIESFAADSVARRLARALLHFSKRFGTETADGSVRMIPFTHELLSEYIGTTREIVTQYMNQFRRQKYLRYSREGIFLDRDAIQDAISADTNSASGATRLSHRTEADVVVLAG